jgi:hypothetical protein
MAKSLSVTGRPSRFILCNRRSYTSRLNCLARVLQKQISGLCLCGPGTPISSQIQQPPLVCPVVVVVVATAPVEEETRGMTVVEAGVPPVGYTAAPAAGRRA